MCACAFGLCVYVCVHVCVSMCVLGKGKGWGARMRICVLVGVHVWCFRVGGDGRGVVEGSGGRGMRHVVQ